MRILGIDPGSVSTGYGVIEGERGSLVHVAHGTVRPPSSAPLGQRLAQLHAALGEVVRLYEPEIVSIERVFFASNARSALVLGHARGAALAALCASGLGVVEISAREIKKSVVGTGAASKAQVQAMVKRLLGLAREPASDAADALAAAICHVHQGRLHELGVVAGRRRRARRPTRIPSRRAP